MKIRQATIVAVSYRTAGTQLVGDHAAGASELLVDDCYDLNIAGGSFSLGDETLTYSGFDDDSDTIFLVGTTADDHVDLDPIAILPTAPTKVATVTFPGSGEAIPARVLHVLDPLLPEGVRDPLDQEQILLLADDDGEFLVLDVLGRPAMIDPANITPVPSPTDFEFFTGPPTHYYSSLDGVLVDYATMLANAGAAWAAAVSAVEFDAEGNLTVQQVASAITPDSPYETSVYDPVWLLPTNGKQAHIEIASTDQDPDDYGSVPGFSLFNQNATFVVRTAATDLTLSGDEVDDFEFNYTFFDDEPNPAGWQTRYFYYHVDALGDHYPTLPPQAWPEAYTEQLQTDPLQSLNPQQAVDLESLDVDPAAPWIALILRSPVDNWPFYNGTDPRPTLTLGGVKVVRT